MIVYHGLTAHKGGSTSKNIFKKAARLFNHLACSDVPYGKIGVAVSGDITDIFYSDCDSFVENGVRKSNATHLKSSSLDEAMEKRIAAKSGGYSVTEYCEIFCKVREISHIWIKQGANAELNRIAALGVPVRIEV